MMELKALKEHECQGDEQHLLLPGGDCGGVLQVSNKDESFISSSGVKASMTLRTHEREENGIF